MLKGSPNFTPDEYPSEEYRTWRLCTLLHCRPSDLDGESAIELDWLLAIDDTVEKVKAELQEKANASGQ